MIPVARVAPNESGTSCCIQVVRDTEYSILRSKKRRNSGRAERSAHTSPLVHESVHATTVHTSALTFSCRSEPEERREEDENDGQGAQQQADG